MSSALQKMGGYLLIFTRKTISFSSRAKHATDRRVIEIARILLKYKDSL